MMKQHKFKYTEYTDLLVQFDKLVRVKNYKTGQGKMYQAAVKEYLLFMERNNVSTLKFNRDHLTSYYDYLIHRPSRRGGTLSDSTINHHLFAFRLLFELLLENNQVSSLPAIPKYLRGNVLEREILTINEVKHLYSLCKTSQEIALISVAYGCGLRRSEIEALNLQDIDLRKGFLIIKSGKNNKRREVPLSDKVRGDLKTYLHEQRIDQVNPEKIEHSFFINQVGTRMRGNSHYQMLKRIVSRSSNEELLNKQVTLHTLRHTIATHLVENGADIQFIKSFLGHTEINTSHLYTIRRKRRVKL